ncbi:hypothetical protein D3C81_1798940 [compost metagenome]
MGSGIFGINRELAHFLGNNTETCTSFSDSCCFNGCVQSEQVCLIRNFANKAYGLVHVLGIFNGVYRVSADMFACSRELLGMSGYSLYHF